jgi:hypothetical protein
MDNESEERRGFRVRDRRRFSESGDPRSEPATEPPQDQGGETATGNVPGPGADPVAEGPVTFSTFVLGLSTQALLHLGEIPNPVTSAIERDLEAAKQVIDILGILAEKTRNNLEPGEQSLLDSALYDLRMRYVELVPRGKKEGS